MLLMIFPSKRSSKISFQTSPEVRHQFRRKLRQLHSGNRWCLNCGPPKSSPTFQKRIRARMFAKKCAKSVGRRYRFWHPPKWLAVGCRFPLEMPTLTWRLPSWAIRHFYSETHFLRDHTTRITVCVCHMLSTRIKRQPQTNLCFFGTFSLLHTAT